MTNTLMSTCPISPPQLIRAESTVERCASCKTWISRYPSFFGEPDNFWQCDKCGCSSVEMKAGRPYGPKAKNWEWVVSCFNEAWVNISRTEWDTVETVPPMNEIDWAAIEKWFCSHNIYRVFIQVDAYQGSQPVSVHLE